MRTRPTLKLSLQLRHLSLIHIFLKYTRNVYYIGNLEFAKLPPGGAHFYDLNGDEIEKQTTEIKWDACLLYTSRCV